MKSVKRLVRMWGVLGLLLALAVAVYGQQATLSGVVYKVELTTSPPYIRFVPEPGVTIMLIDASNASPVASTSSGAGGVFSVTIPLPSGPRHVYAVLSKTGFVLTSTFVVRVARDMSGLRLPIMDFMTYNGLLLIATQICRPPVTQRPDKSIIFTIFHPAGRIPETPADIFRGAMIDAVGWYNPWPNLIQTPPPGDRRHLALHGSTLVCRDCAGIQQAGLAPIASIVFNAERWSHTSGGVWAYDMRVVRMFTTDPVARICLTTVGVAPTPQFITVGLLQCAIMVWPSRGGTK